MSMDGIALRNLELALSRFTRTAIQTNWIVDAGSTTSSIVPKLRNPAGGTIDITGQTQTDLQGSSIEFKTGSNVGAVRVITSADANGTLQLDQPLANTPAVDDHFIIYQNLHAVTSSNDISEVGGVTQTGADWTTLFQTFVAAIAAINAAIPTDAMMIGGSDGTDLRPIATDTEGRLKLAAGTVEIGAFNIEQVGGTAQTGADWTTFFQALYDALAAAGVAVPANVLQVGGTDGTDLRALATDTTGALKLAAGTNDIGSVGINNVGGTAQTAADWTPLFQAVFNALAAAGSAVPTNTMQVGGSDGTDLRTLKTDATGQIYLVPNQALNVGEVGGTAQTGADWTPLFQAIYKAITAAGSAVPTNTLQVGGTDGTDLRAISTDASGNVNVNVKTTVTTRSGSTTVYITTATTTDVKSGAGTVGSITNGGSATSGTITIYDNTAGSGNVLWAGTLTAGQVLALNMPVQTGITVVTAAADTLALSYE